MATGPDKIKNILFMKIRKNKDEDLYLIGFRLKKSSKKPNFYTFMVYGDEDRAVTKNGKLFFFKHPSLALQDWKEISDDIKRLGPAPKKLSLLCDVYKTFHLIQYKKTDKISVILNCLNIFFDLLRSSEKTLPRLYKKILFDFADHLTFNRGYAGFFKNKINDRIKLKKAFSWCVETLFGSIN